uniref:Uncharacterized protein n=1 Tax=Cyclophora tenuis TaxID=216820 RepID=A0A7S1GK62_CYCTE
MDKSDWLHKELGDGGLRQIISEILATSKIVTATGRTCQEEALIRFQSKYPNFRHFIDKLLVVTGILERQEQQEENDEELEDWLLRKEDLGLLTLKPIREREWAQTIAAENHRDNHDEVAFSEDTSSASETDDETSVSDTSESG